MSQTIEYKVKVNTGDSVKTLGQLESELEGINAALKLVEPGSDAFNELAKSAQKANAQVEKINNEIEGLKFEDKIQALDGGIKILGGSVQGLVGGLGLLGIESEKLGAFEEKAASAIAFGIGLKDFSEGLTQVTVAFKKSGIAAKLFGSTARKALISTGIGAIVVALGAIVAYWDEITALVSGVSSETEDLLATQQEAVAASEAQYAALGEQENILKLQGKSEAEIRQLKMDQLKITIDNLKAQLQTQEEMKKAQVEAAQRNKDIAQGIIAFLTAPITILLGAVDALTYGLEKVGVLSEATNLAEGFTGGLAGLIFDPESVEEEGQAAIDETEKKLRQLENQYAGFQLQIKNENDKAAKDAKEKRDAETAEALQKEKDRQDAILAILEDYKQKQLDIEADTNVKKVNLEEERKLAELDALKATEEEKEQIRAFYRERRKEAEDLDAQERAEKEAKAAQEAIDAIYEKIDKEYQLEMERVQMKQYALDSIISLTNSETALGKAALVAKEILNAKELIITAKAALQKIAIESAGAGVDVSRGFASTLKAGFPQNVPLLIAYAAQAAGIIGAIKSAVSSSKSAISSVGGGGGVPQISSPSVPSTPTTSTPTQQQLDIAGATQSKQAPIRAYVISGDVTSAQEAESKIRQRRTVGTN